MKKLATLTLVSLLALVLTVQPTYGVLGLFDIVYDPTVDATIAAQTAMQSANWVQELLNQVDQLRTAVDTYLKLKETYDKIKETYDLEYGKDALEIHEDAVTKGQRILIVDDVLATGGTAAAAVQLIRKLGGELHGLAFLIELLFLNGKEKIAAENVYSVLKY